MSSFAAETTSLEERKRKEADLRKQLQGKTAVQLYFDTKRPWVIVPNGSLMGYFDWVPEKLRVGPWSPFTSAYIVILCGMVAYLHPSNLLSDEQPYRTTILHTYPELFSKMWFYNASAFLWMSIPLYRITRPSGRGGGGFFVMCTYTVQSWTMLLLRHFLTALAPLLPERHWLLRMNESLRFPALLSATVTFMVWNFLLAPFMCIFAMKTPTKRRNFVRWNFSFNLMQIHLFNIIFAICNTVLSVYEEQPSVNRTHKLMKFDQGDLWLSLIFTLAYVLFYLLVLDRFGVHLYPIFSPRSNWFVITSTMVLALIFATYEGWNRCIENSTFLSWAVGFLTA